MWNIITHLCEISRTIWTTIFVSIKTVPHYYYFFILCRKVREPLESRRAQAGSLASVAPDCLCLLCKGRCYLRSPGNGGHKWGKRCKMKSPVLLLILRSRKLLVSPNSLIVLLGVRLSQYLPNSVPIRVNISLTFDSVGKEKDRCWVRF